VNRSRVRFSYLTETDITSIAAAYGRADPTGGGPGARVVERAAA
jgi:hypothetical protein